MGRFWRCTNRIARLAGASVIFTAVSSSGEDRRATGSRTRVGDEYRYVIAGDGAAARAAAEVIAKEDPTGSLLIVAPWWDGVPPGAESGTTHLAAGYQLLGVDPATRTATITGGHTVQYQRGLLLAIGGETPLPPVGSVLSEDAIRIVSGARSATDRARLASVLQEAAESNTNSFERPHFTVVGSGWVSLVTGSSLASQGADVTFVYAEPILLARHVPRYLSAEIRRRLRHISDNGCDYLAYAGIRHVRIDEQSGEADVFAGVVFDPLSGVAFRTDHIIFAPTEPYPADLDAPALERREGAYYTNRELALGTGVYAAGACALTPDGIYTRWTRVHAEKSGKHAARNMIGASEPYIPPRYADINLDTLGTRIRVVGSADAARESLGYFAVANESNDTTCGGNLLRGVLFYLEQEPQKNSSMCLYRLTGALLWDGALGDEFDVHDEQLVDEILAIIDMEACERATLENKLDDFARVHFGVALGVEHLGENVSRVLWRRHTAARTVPLREDEIMWVEKWQPGEFRSASAERADAYVNLLKRSAGVK